MTPAMMVTTALLLGLFVLAGGGYGLCYGAGKLRQRRTLTAIGIGCYVLQLFILAIVLIASPLTGLWKVFLVLSTLAYAVIPPVTWRLLHRLHVTGEEALP